MHGPWSHSPDRIDTPRTSQLQNLRDMNSTARASFDAAFKRQVALMPKEQAISVSAQQRYTPRRFLLCACAQRALRLNSKLVARMRRKGNCRHHAVVESFCLHLKSNVWQKSDANHGVAKAHMASYTVNFYATQRLHSALACIFPAAYDAACA